MNVRRLVLDVDKARARPSLIEMGRAISEQAGVEGFNITVTEIDLETVGLNITIEGTDLDYDVIEGAIQKAGAVVHSVDELAAGERIVSNVPRLRS